MQERRPPVKVKRAGLGDPQAQGRVPVLRTILRSGVIAPSSYRAGVGEDVAAWSSYAAAKRVSKEKELFGKGSIDGLMAARPATTPASPARSFRC